MTTANNMDANNISNDNTQSGEMQDPHDLSLGQPELSDDDIAATLGLMTTIGEQHHMASQPQETPSEAPKQPQDEPKMDKVDTEQDKEIKAIRKELEKLLKHEQDPEDTGAAD